MNHASKSRACPARHQEGIVLLEAMIAIVIFAIGVLGLVGLQASSAKEATNAKYRTDASLLVDQLVGKMWANNRDPVRLAQDFASPDGPEYLKWVGATNQLGSVLRAMPRKTGTGATPLPTVVITGMNGNTPVVSGTAPTSTRVKVTLYWQAPYEDTQHQYSVITQIR